MKSNLKESRWRLIDLRIAPRALLAAVMDASGYERIFWFLLMTGCTRCSDSVKRLSEEEIWGILEPKQDTMYATTARENSIKIYRDGVAKASYADGAKPLRTSPPISPSSSPLSRYKDA